MKKILVKVFIVSILLFFLKTSESRRFDFKIKNLLKKNADKVPSCDPKGVPCKDCKFKCPFDNARFPSPNCKYYYKCAGGKKACLANCPRHTRFESKL